MADIKRFNCTECEYPGGTFGEMSQDVEGEFVLHRDYESVLEHVQILWAQKIVERDTEIARLRAELDNAAAAAVANMSLACEKEREADALRKVIGEVTQCLADTVNEVGGWAVEEVIEAGMTAAMGADA